MGTLTGTTVIELTGIGPAPMAGMLLADMGFIAEEIGALQGNGVVS